MNSDKTLENRLRRKASRHGIRVEKSRSRSLHIDNHGGYMLIDAALNAVIAGTRYDIALADLESEIDARA